VYKIKGGPISFTRPSRSHLRQHSRQLHSAAQAFETQMTSTNDDLPSPLLLLLPLADQLLPDQLDKQSAVG